MISELVSRETIVTAALVYLAIGSLVWFCLYCSGVIHETCRQRPHATVAVVLASIAVIFGWFIFAGAFFARRLPKVRA